MDLKGGNEPSRNVAVEMYMTSFHNRAPATILKALFISERPSPSRIHVSQPFPQGPYRTVYHIRETFIVQADKMSPVEVEKLASAWIFG